MTEYIQVAASILELNYLFTWVEIGTLMGYTLPLQVIQYRAI